MSVHRLHQGVSPKGIIHSGLCVGCGSCVARSGDNTAKMAFDQFGQLKPTGSDSFMDSRSIAVAATCPFSPSAETEDEIAARIFPKAHKSHSSTGRYLEAYVGHVSDDAVRLAGSSGGMATWVLAELMERGLIDGVAHVAAADPDTAGTLFKYRISRTLEEVREAAKSRYYPIEMSEIVNEIRKIPGTYAFVGIPCFIKAINNLRRDDPVLTERIRYTLGLFCGHMKSSWFVNSFAWQMGVEPDQVRAIDFRYKDPSRPANWYCTELQLKGGGQVRQDWWNLVDGDWGAGYFMNSACNFCDDVVGETADISFGDAWVEPYSSDGKGTNAVIVRTQELQQVLSDGIMSGDLKLSVVNGDFIEQTQAAGLRQRREGLAYRLSWHKGLMPRKRVAPNSADIPPRRKLIYRIRFEISRWSHSVFWCAQKLHTPGLYKAWARAAAVLYHGLAYSRGRMGAIVERLGFLGSS